MAPPAGAGTCAPPPAAAEGIPESSAWSAGWDWRPSLPHLLAPADVVPTMRRGARDPGSETLRAASYPDRLVLSALACEAELKEGLRWAGIAPGLRVLDAACGPGVISRFLLDLGAAEVVGCDVGSDMLAVAEALPRRLRPQQQLSFEPGDLTRPLPFADASFDVVFLGDVWLPDAFVELRRVLRPGGAIITKATHAMGVTYAWDLAFDLRVRTAQVDAYDRSTRAGRDPDHAAIPEPVTDAQARTAIGRLRDLGPWTELEVSSVLVERRSPLPEVFSEHLRQSFGIFSGPRLRDLLAPDDWERLLAVYDPASPAYLFARDDLHVMQVLTFARLVP